MNDMELAEEIERHISHRPPGFVIPPYQLYEADAKQIIAALRRRPDRFVPDENPPPRDRPPSGEMVMVPREPTDAMRAAGYQQYVSADKRGYSAWQDHLAVYRAMLSAAEAEGRKG